MAKVKDIRFIDTSEIPHNKSVEVDTNILLLKFYSRLSQNGCLAAHFSLDNFK